MQLQGNASNTVSYQLYAVILPFQLTGISVTKSIETRAPRRIDESMYNSCITLLVWDPWDKKNGYR
jgi:hypothetical protein